MDYLDSESAKMDSLDSDFGTFCKICKKSFATRSNLFKHQRKSRCDIIIKLENENKELHKKLSKINDNTKELNELKQEIKDLKQGIHCKENSKVINSNNSNNNNVNITLVNFGHEEFDQLTQKEILKIISSRYGALRNYVEFTHLNDRLPDQQNVRITNMRSNDCQVIENNKWVTRDVNEVINEIVANGVSNIENYLEENNIQLSGDKLEKLRDLLNKIQDQDNSKFIKKNKLEIKRLLYDNNPKIVSVK
jgi:hypothetical protein